MCAAARDRDDRVEAVLGLGVDRGVALADVDGGLARFADPRRDDHHAPREVEVVEFRGEADGFPAVGAL